MNMYCQDAIGWDPAWSTFEEEVVALMNLERSLGAVCGVDSFGPAGPLVMETALRCAARVHSWDMAVRDFFSHTNPDGLSPWDRIALAEYANQPTGENIAAGYSTPAAVVNGWMNSPGHCSHIMNPNSNEVGIGYYPGGSYGHYWTQTLGRNP